MVLVVDTRITSNSWPAFGKKKLNGNFWFDNQGVVGDV